MPKFIRNACIALAGLMMLLVGASSAYATLSVNATTTTATNAGNSTLFLLRPDGGTAPAICTSFVINGATVSTAGVVNIATGRVVFASCTLNGNPVTVSQTGAWTGQITALLSGDNITGVLLRVNIGTNGVRFNGGAVVLCSFNLSGTASALTTTTSTPRGTLVSVRTLQFRNDALDVLGLTASGVTGSNCGLGGIANNARGSFLSTFAFAPAVTGTLI